MSNLTNFGYEFVDLTMDPFFLLFSGSNDGDFFIFMLDLLRNLYLIIFGMKDELLPI